VAEWFQLPFEESAGDGFPVNSVRALVDATERAMSISGGRIVIVLDQENPNGILKNDPLFFKKLD